MSNREWMKPGTKAKTTVFNTETFRMEVHHGVIDSNRLVQESDKITQYVRFISPAGMFMAACKNTVKHDKLTAVEKQSFSDSYDVVKEID